jgi:HSP20 family protein
MLARWNPWQELFDMQRETSELLRRTFGSTRRPWRLFEPGVDGTMWAPAIDVFNRDGDLVVRAELPGIDPKKDVDISVQKGVLTIRGERRQEERSDGENFYRVESSYGAFQRSVVLPEGVDVDDIQASYDKGVLEVVVPRAAELTAPKKISISSGKRRGALTAKSSKK